MDQQRGIEHQHRTDRHQQDLRREIDDRKDEVELGRLAQAADVQAREGDDHDQSAEDVTGVVVEPSQPRKGAQVMGHEERGDRDREDVVEAQRPAREEGDELVEGVARKRGGPASLGEHRGALGVGLGRQREQAAGEDEHQRREPERVRRDEPERVVDRGADVSVGGREQAGDSDRPA